MESDNVNINAVATKPEFSIEAALAHPAIRLNARLLASIGLERPKAKISRLELEAKMEAANLTTMKRIELKVLLDRVGLLEA
jgi:hypothetical protein